MAQGIRDGREWGEEKGQATANVAVGERACRVGSGAPKRTSKTSILRENFQTNWANA